MSNIKIIELRHDYRVTVNDVDLVSKRKATVVLSDDKIFLDKIQRGADFLDRKLKDDGFIYGVTTGYGDSCTRAVPLDLVPELPVNLSRFHGCGLGEYLSKEQTRAVILVRLASLCLGYSGVSLEMLQRLVMLLNQDILPVIPSEGSVGASGDLTPLSYIAAVLIGEREVWYEDQKLPTALVYKKLGITDYILRPKEALAIMNGTCVMTALASEAYMRARYLLPIAANLTAMTVLALRGNPQHFDAYLFAAKPHPGQAKVAQAISEALQNAPAHYPVDRLQDRYSTRCAPHVIGVLADMLPTFKCFLETEINSANDNPILELPDGDQLGRILHGGHFYGGHIAFVMDSLKNLIANLADLLDRQMATLVDPKFNHGLPANLSGVTGRNAAINHGLKALQIGASAWTAEALKQTMPASVFSRSTECHNQDKVSMGTIAARDALRVLQLTEQVVAAQLIATMQALRIRIIEREISAKNYSAKLNKFISVLSDLIPFIEQDQPLDILLRKIILQLQLRNWELDEAYYE